MDTVKDASRDDLLPWIASRRRRRRRQRSSKLARPAKSTFVYTLLLLEFNYGPGSGKSKKRKRRRRRQLGRQLGRQLTRLSRIGTIKVGSKFLAKIGTTVGGLEAKGSQRRLRKTYLHRRSPEHTKCELAQCQREPVELEEAAGKRWWWWRRQGKLCTGGAALKLVGDLGSTRPTSERGRMSRVADGLWSHLDVT